MGVIHFLKQIKEDRKRPYAAIFDGSMKSYYYSFKGKEDIKRIEAANILDSETVIKIHKEYIQAGAQAIRTNTFGSNRVSMEVDIDAIEGLIAIGVKNAEKAVKESGKLIDIFACIGPIPEYEGYDIFEEYKLVIDTFHENKMKAYCLESFYDLKYVDKIVDYIKSKDKNNYVLVQFELNSVGLTSKGLSVFDIIDSLKDNPKVDIYGFNCGCTPTQMITNINYVFIGQKLLTCMPNSGIPEYIKGKEVYKLGSAEHFGKKMKELYDMGVRVFGGCCGTTPSHIAAMANQLNQCNYYPEIRKVPPMRYYPLEHVGNKFKDKIESGQKILMANLESTTTNVTENVLRLSSKLKAAGVDLVSIPDSPFNKVNVDSIIMASKVTKEVGIETMPHLNCNNSSLMSQRSRLLGMHIESIRNVLTVTGSTHHNRRNVTRILNSSVETSKLINDMNADLFKKDQVLNVSTINPNASDFSYEIERAKNKHENGVNVFITQPVFCAWAVENMVKLRKELGDIKIIGTILPLLTQDEAYYAHFEAPYIRIPNDIFESFENLSEEESHNNGFEIAYDCANVLRHVSDGLNIITKYKNKKFVCKLLKTIKKKLL